MREHIDISGQSERANKSEAKPLLTTVLIPLAMFVLAGLSLLVQNAPWWVTVIIVFFFVLVALVALIPASMRAYRALRTRRQRRAAARRNAVLVRRFLTTLSPSVGDRPGTVFSVWKSAVSFDQGKGQVKPDSVHLASLGMWLGSIDSRLDDSGRKNFDGVCNELGMVVLQHSRLCEQAHREIEALIISGQLTEQNLRNLKQDWSNARDKHNQTIKAWEDLAKNINREAAARITFENYELLKTIG